MAFIVMAHIVVAYIVMAHTVTANTVMAHVCTLPVECVVDAGTAARCRRFVVGQDMRRYELLL